MGFDKIKNKSASMGKKSMSAFLKVNKYENPQTVLDLISHICTSGMDLSVREEFTPYSDKYSQLEEDYSKINTQEAEDPFVEASISNLMEECLDPFELMPLLLDHSGFSDAINVAVGGGYSSGKSSFLNNITGIGAVLPTGIEPVSMINTYISFSDKVTKLIVSGKNCKGHVVKLNREVLDCIQHSSKSKVYVSSVLDELYINVPVSKECEHLKGLVFIDTPGYNNSDNANKENGKKDIDTASDALEYSDALFWCIDAEAGTISQRDIEMLNKQIDYNHGNYPFVIVFNKMDKKPDDEIVKILQSAEKVCKSKLNIRPIDIIGFSSIGESAIYSLKNKQKATTRSGVIKVLASIIYKMKDGFSNTRSVSYWTNWLADCFDQEIKACDEKLAGLEKDRKELAKKKAEAFSKSTTSSEEQFSFVNDHLPLVEDVIIKSYDDILDSRDGLIDLLDRAMKGWSKALDREDQWAKKTGFFSDASNLQRQSNNAVNEYKRVMTAAEENLDEFEFWNTESRKNVLVVIRFAYESADEDVQDSLEEDYDNTVASKKTISIYKSFLQKKKQEIVHVFTTCCENAIKKNEKRLRALQNIKEEEETDVFSAIANDNMNRFLDCFSSGVDLTKCNSQGYSPLTYVAKNSNNAMMKFLIDHEVDLSLKDKNGYNALETAAIYHCQDICELLINADKGLLMESQSLTKLAANDRFENWISNF